MTEPRETSRGYKLDGPDKDGEIAVESDASVMWFTREDLEMMLKMFDK